MTHQRKHYQANRLHMARFRFRANQRAAKERIRLDRAARDEPMPDTSHVRLPRRKPSGFRVVITCLDDGERVQFTAFRTPWGLSISPTAAGRKVFALLSNYTPKGITT
jgi:hypothetical protein